MLNSSSVGKGLFSLNPGQNVGPFVIDMTLNDAVELLESREDGGEGFGLVRVSSSREGTPVVLDLVDIGILLWFDALSQRLRCIEIADASRIPGRLVCRGVVFEKNTRPVTYGTLYNAYGCTTDQEVDENKHVKPLVYPGLLGLFKIDDECSSVSEYEAESIFVLPQDALPVSSRKEVFESSILARQGEQGRDSWLVVLGKGMWKEHDPCNGGIGCSIRFGVDTPQDILHILGLPEDVHKKTMKTVSNGDEYVFNYYTKGLDVVFDGQRHVVKTCVLHTNTTRHAEFGRYDPALFSLLPSGMYTFESDGCSNSGSSEDGMEPNTLNLAIQAVKSNHLRELLADAEETGASSGSQSPWVSAASSPGMSAPNFGPIAQQHDAKAKQHKKKTNKKKTKQQQQQQQHISFDVSNFYTIDRFEDMFGDCLQSKPSIIYWTLDTSRTSTKTATALAKSYLYKFPDQGLDVEFASDDTLAAVYLSATKHA